jgi:hypothetical protein
MSCTTVYEYSFIEKLAKNFSAVLDENIISKLLEIKKNNKFIRRKSPIRLKYKISTANIWRKERENQELSDKEMYINLIVSNLNKISNKNYSLILDEIININKQYHDKMETSLILSNTIFNKSMDENIYSNLYAKLINDLNISDLNKNLNKKCNDFFEEINKNNEITDNFGDNYDELCAILKQKSKMLGGYIFIANLFKYDIVEYEIVKDYYLSLIHLTKLAKEDTIGKYIDSIVTILNNCGKNLNKNEKNFKEIYMDYIYELVKDKERVKAKYKFKLMDVTDKYENNWELSNEWEKA